jgi:hypothetical protein
MVAHTVISAIWEVQLGRIEVQDQLEQKLGRPHLNK